MPPPPLEIERKYLLDGHPELPPDAVAVRMEQGYLPEGGRVRRAVKPDGSVRCTHTMKHGAGLVREELERELTEDDFDRQWPLTAGRRLRKTRHSVPEGDFTWEVDVYDDLDLVLAEVELPTADTSVTPPPWLAKRIVREVTEEPAYTNHEIAFRIGLAQDA